VIDGASIQEFSQAVAREFRPEKIVLFDSYAYGTPTEDFDVDLPTLLTSAAAATLAPGRYGIENHPTE